jgi:hypothetical protein
MTTPFLRPETKTPLSLEQALQNEHVQRWRDAALALPEERIAAPGLPIHAYLDHADYLMGFFERHWAPGEKGRPGLESLESFLPRTSGEQIHSLIQACRALQTQVLFPGKADAEGRQALVRGRVVADQLSAALDYALDDGVETASDLALESAWKRLAAGSSAPVLAQALSDFAGIAAANRELLARIKGFDLGLIEEARTLVEKLGGRDPSRGRPASATVELRNRLLTLLEDRLEAVRRAARYLFRDRPELLRRLSPDYWRSLRARRAARAEPLLPASPADGATTPVDADRPFAD